MYLNRWLRKPSVSKRHLKQEAGGREWASFAKSKRKSHPGRGNGKCPNPGMQEGLASSGNWASSRSAGLLTGKRLNLTHVLRIRISSPWYHRVGGEPDTIYSKFLSKRVLSSKTWSCLLYLALFKGFLPFRWGVNFSPRMNLGRVLLVTFFSSSYEMRTSEDWTKCCVFKEKTSLKGANPNTSNHTW